MDTKPTNPKDIIGSAKLPLHLWPTTATILGALALMDGALKYGRSNWREAGVRATIYVDAARRHLDAWLEGEDDADDSSVPHLGHALACIAILIDAQAHGKLVDDRLYGDPRDYRRFIDTMTERVKVIQANHEGKDPKHYTIEDMRARPSDGDARPVQTGYDALFDGEQLLDFANEGDYLWCDNASPIRAGHVWQCERPQGHAGDHAWNPLRNGWSREWAEDKITRWASTHLTLVPDEEELPDE